jgi:hypothetical protein
MMADQIEDRRGRAMNYEEKPQIDIKLVRQSAIVRAKTFQAIGHFIYQFSQLEFTIRAVLTAYLQLPDQYFDAVTGPYDFRMLVAVTSKVGQIKYPERADTIKAMFKECFDLMTVRNHIAHGLWSDGIMEWSVRHYNREKLEGKHIPYTSDQINEFAKQAQMLLQKVMGFNPQHGSR